MYSAELQMLREFFKFFAPIVHCCFCDEPILDTSEGETFGHRRHTKVRARFTIHHDDEDRTNNDRPNLKPAHPECHKRYHNQKRRQQNVHLLKPTMQSGVVESASGLGARKLPE